MSRLSPFAVTRNGSPIEQTGVRGAIDPHISYNMLFSGMEAAIAAGATLDELHKWLSNAYPRWFMLLVMAWHKMHGLIHLHSEDAVARASSKKGR